MPEPEWVILVDENDRERGRAEKLRVHRTGELHRAFSVFVLNPRGEVLLQRRARSKYHSGGLWSNTCCGHPRPGEDTATAARRRLHEEMGLDCDLERVSSFLYHAHLDGGLQEHELDHVFVARSAALPRPDRAEVEAWRWADPAALRHQLRRAPHAFTHWFSLALAALLPAHRPPPAPHVSRYLVRP